MILLDTSFLIDYFRGVEETRDIIVDKEPIVSTISYHEIMTGIKLKKATKEKQYFTRFFSEVKLLPFHRIAADFSSDINAKLLAIGKNVNTLDILIAGTAIANGVFYVATRDSDFGEIAKVSEIEAIIY